jgi:putative transposase
MAWRTQDLMNQRTEFALKALITDNFQELCREYGISPRVGYKWLARFKEEGTAGMEDRSRRPKSSPEALAEEVICRMVRLKEHHRRWGPRKIRELYLRQFGAEKTPSESSFKRVLERCGLTEKRRVARAHEQGRVCSGLRAKEPNEVWTVDFKGWWHDSNGRCEPLTVRDEASRYVLELRALGDARTETVQACFERLFERYGLPGAIRSDNGPPFASSTGLLGLSRLSAWWLVLGIDLERGRPGCPQDNGGHERMHRDIAAELEGADYKERQPTLDVWRCEFNQERPHEALEMKTPQEVYRESSRKWEGPCDALEYEGAIKRRVQASGRIGYEGESIFLSSSLRGWDVGLKPTKDGRLEVHFARLLLGHLDPESIAFVPAQGVGGPNPETTSASSPEIEP